MTRDHFDHLWCCIRFSKQPAESPAGMSSEAYRWMLVDDFVALFNGHRKMYFEPSHILTVNESMVRWYGLGGTWINMGLPHYLAIDRKPENGCEIQNAACGISGVMLKLKIVKLATHKPENPDPVSHGGIPHGGIPHCGRVLMELVLSWSGSNRIVCADSYFASVPAALALRRIGLKFIGF
jgi:Transposase IS4